MATGETLRRWRKDRLYRLTIDFTRGTEQRPNDQALIDKLEEQPNKSGYIKQLIKGDIERDNSE